MITGDGAEKEGPAGGNLKASARTAARESFFIQYAKEVREKYPSVPLMVTGGFRTRLGMQMAIEEGGCDLIGVGRPACVEPRMPNTVILNKNIADEDAKIRLDPVVAPWYVRLLGVRPLTAGVVTVSVTPVFTLVFCFGD